MAAVGDRPQDARKAKRQDHLRPSSWNFSNGRNRTSDTWAHEGAVSTGRKRRAPMRSFGGEVPEV